MRVFGIMMVRNEEDVLTINVLHHLSQGIDHFLIVDNGSTDGTPDILEQLSAGGRVSWTTEPGPYRQWEITTELAREAFWRGADWVIPIDADEFWWGRHTSIRSVIEASPSGALGVEVLNFIQRRDVEVASAEALLSMTGRTLHTVGPPDRVRELVEDRQISLVEMAYPPKWISRTSPAIQIEMGNHGVLGIPGPTERTDSIVCLHAPFRARSLLAAKVIDHGRRAQEVELKGENWWHARRWSRLDETQIQAEWAANSFLGDVLDVYGMQHHIGFDNTLANVVEFSMRQGAQGDGDGMPRGDLERPLILRTDCKPSRTEVETLSLPLTPLNGALNAAPILDPSTRAFIMDPMRRIAGWLRDEEAELLMVITSLVTVELPDTAIVEVGSYCGKSTSVLGGTINALASNLRVYAIDPHEGEFSTQDSEYGVRRGSPTYGIFSQNMVDAGLSQTVEAIRLPSYAVTWHDSIGLLFIDGLHDYLNVSRDYFHFESCVTPGGYVAFHDCEDTYPGVQAVVRQVLASGRYRAIQQTGALAVLQKLPEHGSGDTAARTKQTSGMGTTQEGDDMTESAAEHRGVSAGTPGKLQSLEYLVARQAEGIGFLQQELARRTDAINEKQEEVGRLWGGIRERDEEIISGRELIAQQILALSQKQDEIDRLADALQGREAQIHSQTETIRELKVALPGGEEVRSHSTLESLELATYRQSKLVRVVRMYWALRERLFKK